MGVPGFFAWLLKNYDHNQLIINSLKMGAHTLYIDANCLFHPQCFKVLDLIKKKMDKTMMENLMIKRIINYIEFLINFAKPTKLIYIAVDGVAPFAKVSQQRIRRYKSIHDAEIKEEMEKRYNIIKHNKWSNIVITPGTEFMEKLHQCLTNHFKKSKSKATIIYSSYHEPGEGEHKILQPAPQTCCESPA